MLLTVEQPEKQTIEIPKSLIYETFNGKTFYRKGYRNVLKNNLNPKSIMGSSSLQSILVSLLNNYIGNQTADTYILATNEPGLHLDFKENMSNDIMLFLEKDFQILNEKYFNLPPKIVVEVDVKIEIEEYATEEEYVFEKTARLLDFGVEKVIWVLTKTKKIVIAEKSNKNWIVTDWLQEIEITPDCKLVLNDLLKTRKWTKPYSV